MRALVTGATGAFGAPLCAALAEAGVEVDAMARRPPATPFPPGVRYVAGDVTDPDSLDGPMAGADVVVHLAWLVGVARDPSDAERINLDGTRNVLEAMQRHSVGRLVFASSVLAYGAEYGHPPYREGDELRPDPVLQYGDHKRIVEGMIEASGIPTLVCRPAAVVGRHVTGQSATVFATPVLLGVRGEDHPWQFVHQDDVVRFLVDAVLSGRTGLVNLAAPDTMSLEQLGERIGRRVVRLPAGAIRRGIGAAWALHLSDVNPAAMETLRAFPVADTTRLADDVGFQTAWTSRDTVVDSRRAVGGMNVLGNVVLRRRGTPPLPPLGGSTERAPLPAAVAGAVAEALGADRAASPLGTELAERAGGSVTPLSARQAATAARWATRESPLVLGCHAGGATSDPVLVARRNQRWDHCIDLLALAAGAGSGPAARTILDVARPALVALAEAVDGAGTSWDEAHRAWAPVFGR